MTNVLYFQLGQDNPSQKAGLLFFFKVKVELKDQLGISNLVISMVKTC